MWQQQIVQTIIQCCQVDLICSTIQKVIIYFPIRTSFNKLWFDGLASRKTKRLTLFLMWKDDNTYLNPTISSDMNVKFCIVFKPKFGSAELCLRSSSLCYYGNQFQAFQRAKFFSFAVTHHAVVFWQNGWFSQKHRD